MKKIIVLAIFALLFSCSTEEQVIEASPYSLDTNANAHALAEGLAKGMRNVKIDFSSLFHYSNPKEAQTATNRFIEKIKSNAKQELSARPGCTHAYIEFYLQSGKSKLVSVQFANTNEKVIQEHISYSNNNIFPGERDITKSTKAYQLIQENLARNFLALNLSDNGSSLNDYISLKLKDDNPAGFIVVVDGSSSEVYGLK